MGGAGRAAAALGEGVGRSAALAGFSTPGSVMEERLARSDWGRLVREAGGAEAVWGAGAYR
eukprot:3405471-Pleurochrysis_carterae.AAC.1